MDSEVVGWMPWIDSKDIAQDGVDRGVTLNVAVLPVLQR